MNEMTDEQINQAVAECQGWTKIAPWALDSKRLRGYPPDDNGRDFVPNFVESRDAMAGALATLSEEEWRRFIDLLWVEIGSPALKKADNLNDIVGDLFVMFKAFLLATPLQACRAFLKAKGKL